MSIAQFSYSAHALTPASLPAGERRFEVQLSGQAFAREAME